MFPEEPAPWSPGDEQAPEACPKCGSPKIGLATGTAVPSRSVMLERCAGLTSVVKERVAVKQSSSVVQRLWIALDSFVFQAAIASAQLQTRSSRSTQKKRRADQLGETTNRS